MVPYDIPQLHWCVHSAGHLGWQSGDGPQLFIYNCNGIDFHLEHSDDNYSLSIFGKPRIDLGKWGFPDQLTSDVLRIVTRYLPHLKQCHGVRRRASLSLTNAINVERVQEEQFIRDKRCTGVRGFLSSSESCRRCTMTYQNLVSTSAKKTVCTWIVIHVIAAQTQTYILHTHNSLKYPYIIVKCLLLHIRMLVWILFYEQSRL